MKKPFIKNIDPINSVDFIVKKDKIDALLHECYAGKIRDWRKCKNKARAALSLSEEIEYQEGRGIALLELGYQNWFRDNLTLATDQLSQSRSILKTTDNEFMFARATAVNASICWTKGDRNTAVSIMFEALRKIGSDNKNALWIIWFSGIFYFDLQDYKNAEFQYLKALAIINSSSRETPDAYAYCIIGLGGVLMKTNRTELAIDHFKTALKFCQKNGYWMQEARVLHDLGTYHEHRGEIKEALTYFQRSYLIRNDQQTKPALITSLLSLARVISPNNNVKAINLVDQGLKLSETINSKPKRLACHKMLANLHKSEGNLQQSHTHLEESEKLSEYLAGNQVNADLKNLEKDFIEELFRRERRALSRQNTELEQANRIIQSQYNEIADSINYARKIQNAILPPLYSLEKHLPESFLLYLPKAVVSGDFYWLESIDEDIVLFAVADCTGHGVPGAMTSMLCIGALNRAVREFGLTEPAAILDKTRDIIISDFQDSKDELHDGMDISLCSLNKKTLEINYAGAFNPLWIVRKESNKLEELVGDKQPIGNYPLYNSFINHSFYLEKGDQLFIFSDGFADQFGGLKNKKFTSKRFKSLILENAHLPLEIQKEILLKTFQEWKGTTDQIDDISILGVKI